MAKVLKEEQGKVLIYGNKAFSEKSQEKTITPSTNAQVVTADEGYTCLSKVNVEAVTSAIDSNIIAENIKKDVSILGVVGTLESGGSSNVVTGFTYGSGTNILTLEGITSVPKNLFLCYLRGDSSDNILITDQKCMLTVSFTNNTATSGNTNYLRTEYNSGKLYVNGWQDEDCTFKYENNTLTIQYSNPSYIFTKKRYYYLIEY